MSKKKLHELSAKHQAEAVKQLYDSPRPKTIHREPAEPVKRAKKKHVPSYDNSAVMLYFRFAGLLGAVAEHRFHPERKWRFDFAWPDAMVALEVEGGVWTGGRHTRGAGFIEDMRKYNAATELGWRVFRITPDEIYHLETVLILRRALARISPQSP